MATLLDILPYADIDWSVVPTRPGSKRPAVKSVRKWRETAPTRKVLWRWFHKGDHDVAVLLGEPSGNLCVRDFDDNDAYRIWKAKYPALARKLPTSRTARGRHLFFHADLADIEALSPSGSRMIKYADGELKAGGLAQIPPSVHESGRTVYRWERQPFDDVPYLTDLVAAGLAQPPESWVNPVSPESAEIHNPLHSIRRHTQDKKGGTRRASECVELDVASVIAMTLPEQAGQRNDCLFRFARLLKQMPEYWHADPADLKKIVREWHRKALPVIRTRDWLTTWTEFQSAFRRVRFPGDSEMGEFRTRAIRAGCPPEVLDDCDGDPSGLAAGICRELARENEGVFFVTCRALGQQIGTSHADAATILRGLVSLGLIDLARGGHRGRASTYRYLGEL